jgi:hypothetical protein
MFFCILFSLSVSVQENIDWDEEAIDDLDMGIIRLMPDTFGHSQKLFQKTVFQKTVFQKTVFQKTVRWAR